MKRKIISLFAAALIIAASFTAAHAGLLLINSEKSLSRHGSESTSKVYIEDGMMRVDTTGEDANTMIYRKDKGLFWVINKGDNTYSEITRQDIKKMKKQMDSAMSRMQEQMRNMPPQQRQMMAQMMKGRMPSKPAKTVFRKGRSGVKVNKWKCTEYSGFRQGEKVRSIWTADWKKLGMSRDDIDVINGMSEFFEGLAGKNNKESFMRVGSRRWEHDKGYAGVPVKTVTYKNGRKMHVSELKAVKRKNFSSSLFDLPGGLKKMSFERGMH